MNLLSSALKPLIRTSVRPAFRPPELLAPFFVNISLVFSSISKNDLIKITVPRKWPFKNKGFGASDFMKPCKNKGFRAPDFTKPYKNNGFRAPDFTKPYKNKGF